MKKCKCEIENKQILENSVYNMINYFQKFKNIKKVSILVELKDGHELHGEIEL